MGNRETKNIVSVSRVVEKKQISMYSAETGESVGVCADI